MIQSCMPGIYYLYTFQVSCMFLYCIQNVWTDPLQIFLFHTDQRLTHLEKKIEQDLQLFCGEVSEDLVLKFNLVTTKQKPLYIFVVPPSISLSSVSIDTILNLFEVHAETAHVSTCNAHMHNHS